MSVFQRVLSLGPRSRGLHEVTAEVAAVVGRVRSTAECATSFCSIPRRVSVSMRMPIPPPVAISRSFSTGWCLKTNRIFVIPTRGLTICLLISRTFSPRPAWRYRLSMGGWRLVPGRGSTSGSTGTGLRGGDWWFRYGKKTGCNVLVATGLIWWAIVDSNHRLPPCEDGALTS